MSMRKFHSIISEKYNLLKNGIFCLNKKENITSSDCVQLVKKILIKELGGNKKLFKIKVGHGGTLDYDASGVLVIGINYGCKILTQFLHGNKSYLVSGKFGEATDTYNKLGNVTQSSSYALNSYAHVTKLCRIKQGSYILEDCLGMEHLNLERILHACHKSQSKFPHSLIPSENHFKI
nr:probable tRNA pseudouridine synthase 1 isoform X2 [Halyomorpha halys]